MLTIQGRKQRFCDGMTRRDALHIGAVAMGAMMIEKHFTLDRNAPGPDHKASIEPWEMGLLVVGADEVEKALGDGIKKAELCEAEVIDIRDARRAHRDSR